MNVVKERVAVPHDVLSVHIYKAACKESDTISKQLMDNYVQVNET